MFIRFTVTSCPLGRLLLAVTGRGACAIMLGDRDKTLTAELRRKFPKAQLDRDDSHLGSWVGNILRYLDGRQPHVDVPLDVDATPFQREVWKELQAIPYGQTRTYQQIAKAVGRPRAVRAVGQACGNNPVALVIPCHRAVRSDGELGGYRWGVERKQKLLEQEKWEG